MMELSTDVLKGLTLCSDSRKITDQAFKKLLRNVVDCLLTQSDNNLSKEKGAEQVCLKESFWALCTFFLEAAKHDRDGEALSHILEDCKWSTDRIEGCCNIYMEHKQQLRILLSSTGYNPPHIVDVDWRLNYYVKNNHLEKVSEPRYLINLQTEHCGLPNTENIQFSCTQDQLQDLVGKLKDACKSIERAAQQ